MAQDWDIRPRSDACTACERTFNNREVYTTALVFGEDGYQRADYCNACWEKAPQDTPFSVWQGTFLLPPPKAEEPMKKETAESLLRHLMEDDDEADPGVIFILAVMLERKKLLVEKDVKTDEDRNVTRFYEHKKTGETFVVPDPGLRLDELESVQLQVVTLLGGPAKKKEKAGAEDVKPGEGAGQVPA